VLDVCSSINLIQFCLSTSFPAENKDSPFDDITAKEKRLFDLVSAFTVANFKSIVA
jgi:hypothetical protein